MTTTIVRRLSAFLVISSSAYMAGCSTIESGLVGAEHENLLPFAEQTVASMGVERIDFRDSEFAYLRVISDPKSPEIESLQKLLALADEFRDEIIYYSIEIVRIAEMNLTDIERVQEYANALRDMRQQIPIDLNISDTEYGDIDADIRSQENFLAALRAAQPLIDRAGSQFENLIRDIEERSLVDAVSHLDNLIEDHYSEFMRYNDIMVQRRNDLLSGLALIREYRLGNERAMIAFRNLSVVQNRDLEIPDAPTARNLENLEEYLLNQMERDIQVVSYLNTDVDGYLNAHAELQREEAEVIDGLNVARLQIVAWTRAHQAMSSGAKEPGKWLKVAMDAAGAASRVP